MNYLIPPLYCRLRIRVIGPISAIAQGVGYAIENMPHECFWEDESTSNIINKSIQLGWSWFYTRASCRTPLGGKGLHTPQTHKQFENEALAWEHKLSFVSSASTFGEKTYGPQSKTFITFLHPMSFNLRVT